MLPTVKSFEILPRHNEYGFVLESFALNKYIFPSLKDLVLSVYEGSRKSFHMGHELF